VEELGVLTGEGDLFMATASIRSKRPQLKEERLNVTAPSTRSHMLSNWLMTERLNHKLLRLQAFMRLTTQKDGREETFLLSAKKHAMSCSSINIIPTIASLHAVPQNRTAGC